MPDWLRSTEDRSITPGRPAKNPGERAIVASISWSQSRIGTVGTNTKAT